MLAWGQVVLRAAAAGGLAPARHYSLPARPMPATMLLVVLAMLMAASPVATLQRPPPAPAPKSWKVVGSPGGASISTEGASSFPSLAISPKDGTAHLAYFAESATGTKAVVRRYTGDVVPGTFWSVLPYFQSKARSTPHMRLAFFPGGTPLVASFDKLHKSVNVSRHQGAGWSPLGGGTAGTGNAYSLDFAVGSNGRACTAWSDADAGYRAHAACWNGADLVKLTGPLGLSAFKASYVSVAVAPSGAVFLAYSATGSAEGITLAYIATVVTYNANTLQWNRVGAFASTNESYYLSLALQPATGTPYLSYSDRSERGRATVVRRAAGGKWLPVGPRGFTPSPINARVRTQLAFTSAGRPVLTYGNADAGGEVRMMRHVPASNTWLTVCGGPVATYVASFNGFSAALGPGDVPWVATVSLVGFKNYLLVRRCA